MSLASIGLAILIVAAFLLWIIIAAVEALTEPEEQPDYGMYGRREP